VSRGSTGNLKQDERRREYRWHWLPSSWE
jgi:hypothetical protein